MSNWASCLMGALLLCMTAASQAGAISFALEASHAMRSLELSDDPADWLSPASDPLAVLERAEVLSAPAEDPVDDGVWSIPGEPAPPAMEIVVGEKEELPIPGASDPLEGKDEGWPIPVPEPSTVTLLGVGALALVRLHRRRSEV